jgi:LPXTG-site transpeptidase (sortase) family protein
MYRSLKSTAKLCLDNIGLFMGAVAITFVITVVVLAVVGLFPESSVLPTPKAVAEKPSVSQAPVSQSVNAQPSEYPSHIRIPSAGVDTMISNPTTDDESVFNADLLKGVVRYPKSALLGENANVFLFGHSSSIKIVRNKAYKAFNNIGTLKQGDEIYVSSATREYMYRVVSVSQIRESEAVVGFETGTKMLTLATCNVLGEKEDRFLVQAEFVKSTLLNNQSVVSN